MLGCDTRASAFARDRTSADSWSRRHLPRLAELDARAPATIAGDTLVHFDIRGDNVLLAADRVVVLVGAVAQAGEHASSHECSAECHEHDA
jgi:Ser/Thr protein kinase RdoA (MazF antagonist)